MLQKKGKFCSIVAVWWCNYRRVTLCWGQSCSNKTQNCLSPYFVRQNVVIGEMTDFVLLDMKSKPNKYGIKFYPLDVTTFFVLNIERYCGKQPNGPDQLSNAAGDVKRLITSIWIYIAHLLNNKNSISLYHVAFVTVLWICVLWQSHTKTSS